MYVYGDVVKCVYEIPRLCVNVVKIEAVESLALHGFMTN